LERGWIHGRRSSKGLNDVFFGNDFAYQSLILTTLPVGFPWLDHREEVAGIKPF
jgi:hypothetical protein